jgi:hypothetical protein
VLVLASRLPDKALFARFLETAKEQHGDVYFIGAGGTDLVSRDIGVAAVASERFQMPEYESPVNRYPTGVRQKEFDYGVYRFTDGAPVGGSVELDIGHLDDLNVVRFHAKERTGDRTFRWTRDVSYVTIAQLPPGATRVVLWMHDGGRPPGAPAAEVALSVDGQPLGEARVGSGFRPYELQLPAGRSQRDAPIRFRLDSTTWNPREAIGAADPRDLGVMVDRMIVE